MSLQWTLVAGFLYAELALLVLLLLPYISDRVWSSILRISFIRKLERQFVYYFYCLISILILCFLDSIREMTKYSSREDVAKEQGMRTLQLEMQQQMRMFRAQRNFYIVGFALFLSLVIKRLLELIMFNNSLEVENTAVLQQAENASKVADSTFCSYSKSEELKKLTERIENARNETKAANLSVESMTTQAQDLSEEYERLMKEKEHLEEISNKQ
eukprot:GFUD01012525.1.p1 GENE.GFUD01012525.1~~GFUD01012525.1.p1  ORF type:complete len:247 (+),score=42.30 GFUD01012525.1:97-741(+)